MPISHLDTMILQGGLMVNDKVIENTAADFISYLQAQFCTRK